MAESSSSARTEGIRSYVSEATKREIDGEADRQGMTRSSLIARYVQEGLRRDREDDLATETDAARRLGDVIDAGLDDMEDIARHTQDLNAKTGVYAVAAFELLKKDHGDAAVRKALKTGARRLREDELPDPDEIAADTDDAEEGEGSTLRDRLRGDDQDDRPGRVPDSLEELRAARKDNQDDRPGRSPPSPEEVEEASTDSPDDRPGRSPPSPEEVRESQRDDDG